MSTNGTQGSGYKEKHQNSNSKAKGPGSSSSNATTVNNNITSSGYSNNATSVQTPRKPIGYTFNNGQEKQPILRAQEYEPEDFHSDDGEATGPAVGLNFNFWMEHSYVVDQQISNVITQFICPNKVQKKSGRSNAIARGTLEGVKNVVILSVQDVDPRELNDNIYTLPFLSTLTTMPICHVSETTPSAASFDESVFANASGEQLWQYLDVAQQNAMMLWTERPTVSINSLVGVSIIELLTKYTLTFMGIHTQWQDEVVFYSDANPHTLTNNPTTVQAFQDMARQKLVGCKDAPAYMLQMFCEMTKPPTPGDIFGRCSKAHAKETGLFLYRPGTTTNATTPATKARFLVLWFRAKEIDVLEEANSPEETHSKLNVYASSDTTEHTRTFAKVVPPVVVGKGRFQETLDFVMTLRKAVLRAHPAGFENRVSAVGNSGFNNGVSSSTAGDEAVVPAVSTENSVVSTTTHEYFDHALQHQLRTQFASPAFKDALNSLVLSQPMQILMGFVVSRAGGYEDFIDTSEGGFYSAHGVGKGGILTSSEVNTMVKAPALVKEKEELEDGECEESDVSVAGSTHTTPAVSAEKQKVNKKIYFPDTDADKNLSTSGKMEYSAESSDADDNMAVLMATTARKRKAHLLAQQEEEGEGQEGTETTSSASAPEVVSNKKSKTSVMPPPAPTNISDLINMYTPQALKAANSNTNTSSNNSTGINNGVTPSKGVVTGNSGVKPPLPPLPPPPTSTFTSTSNAIHSATKTNDNTTITTNSVVTTVTTPIEPYQCTLIPLHTIKTPLEMVALDCEMCTTSQGLELTRLTVLCPLNGVVYDTLVRPESEITDYHTEFSGITHDQLVNVTTTLKDVQDTLRQLISDRTIIVGHSADTDLKVLQLVHSRVIDTSALYPHPTGLPYKHSLKKLAKDYLHKDIQDGKEGHDSVQDAAIALELAFLKAKQGESGSFICPWLDDPVPKCSIFEPLLSCESSTAPSLSVSVHGIPSVLGYGTHVWEDFAFGYRPEGDSCLNVEHCRAALQARLEGLKSNSDPDDAGVRELCDRLQAQIEQLRHQRHGTTEEAVTHALQDLSILCSSGQDSDGDSNISMKKSLTIVEMCCGDEMQPEDDAHSMHSESDAGYNTYEQDYSGGEESVAEGKEEEEEGESFLRGPPRQALTGLARIDHYAQQLLQAAPANTLLLVVTQGNFKAMRQLASRKLRNRWEQAALKRKQSLVGLGRVYWDASLDESRLIAAAAHATAGAVFLVKK